MLFSLSRERPYNQSLFASENGAQEGKCHRGYSLRITDSPHLPDECRVIHYPFHLLHSNDIWLTLQTTSKWNQINSNNCFLCTPYYVSFILWMDRLSLFNKLSKLTSQSIEVKEMGCMKSRGNYVWENSTENTKIQPKLNQVNWGVKLFQKLFKESIVKKLFCFCRWKISYAANNFRFTFWPTCCFAFEKKFLLKNLNYWYIFSIFHHFVQFYILEHLQI